jgi:hypothetical protein
MNVGRVIVGDEFIVSAAQIIGSYSLPRFGGEIGAYTAHLNFCRWEMLGALPRTKYRGEVL